MKFLTRLLVAAPLLAVATSPSAVAIAQESEQALPRIFIGEGVCEPSGAVAVRLPAGRQMLIVANDGDNVLRAYAWSPEGLRPPIPILVGPTEPDQGSGPAAQPSRDLNDFLRVPPGDRGKGRGRADIEAAARLGNMIFWMGSHSRSSDGDLRANRHRFFATTGDVRQLNNGPQLVLGTIGSARDLMGTLTAEHLGLRADIGVDANGAPVSKGPGSETGGLNIEGLARDLDGSGLLIGLRSPLRGGRALVLPFLNPRQVVTDAAAAPRIGDPIELGLGGRGVRSIEYVQNARPDRRYLIVAGPAGSGDDFSLYWWSGVAGQAPVEIDGSANMLRRLGQVSDGRGSPFRFGPEALVVNEADPEGRTIHLLSDDGDRPMSGAKLGARCQDDDTPVASRSFRGVTVQLD